MSFNIKWDQSGERFYETGVDRGVLYPQVNGAYPKGVAWNGLTAVNESPSGAEATPMYADNIKYLNLMSAEEFGASVEAYTYPEEFAACNGEKAVIPGVYVGQQTRQAFGMCYRTKIGDDLGNENYKLHLIYGALAAPSEKGYTTVNDTPEAMTLSWELTTTPVEVTGCKPTACLTIDSRTVDATNLAALEKVLYGTAAEGEGTAVEGYLPLPDAVIAILKDKTAG